MSDPEATECFNISDFKDKTLEYEMGQSVGYLKPLVGSGILNVCLLA